MRKIISIAAIGGTAVLAAACGTTISQAPAGHTAAPAAPKAATPAAASPSQQPLTGPAGTTFEVTGNNGPSGAQTVYSVTLDQVQQHAVLGQYGSLTNGSDHVAAAEFTVTGKTGQTSDDANNDAIVVGTDRQDYDASFDTITSGTDFSDGEFHVSPGQTLNGWVSFELAPGASIASVQWSPSLGGDTATWTISK